jgi:hypothetical protein
VVVNNSTNINKKENNFSIEIIKYRKKNMTDGVGNQGPGLGQAENVVN